MGLAMDLGIARVESTETCGVLAFPAEVDLSNGEAILAQAVGLLDAGAPGLILDLTDCTFCDSSGLNVITRSQMRASELGVPMWVVLPQRGIVRRVSDVAGLQRRVAIAPDVATAREALTVPYPLN
ncbi:STAS domain-containing protein [Actinomadura macra]|uniref:STAS domain-containing protein n=1 Tax=Actinomadura macra TaxID=46164 RepID=UPI0012F8486D|nr:STAS domain-containing protein [Actinomadura macra]